MLGFFLTLLFPVSRPGEDKISKGFPAVFLFVLAIACAVPMILLYGWSIGIATAMIAFLLLCGVRMGVLYLGMDDEGYITASVESMVQIASIMACVLVAAFWLTMWGPRIGWTFMER